MDRLLGSCMDRWCTGIDTGDAWACAWIAWPTLSYKEQRLPADNILYALCLRPLLCTQAQIAVLEDQVARLAAERDTAVREQDEVLCSRDAFWKQELAAKVRVSCWWGVPRASIVFSSSCVCVGAARVGMALAAQQLCFVQLQSGPCFYLRVQLHALPVRHHTAGSCRGADNCHMLYQCATMLLAAAALLHKAAPWPCTAASRTTCLAALRSIHVLVCAFAPPCSTHVPVSACATLQHTCACLCFCTALQRTCACLCLHRLAAYMCLFVLLQRLAAYMCLFLLATPRCSLRNWRMPSSRWQQQLQLQSRSAAPRKPGLRMRRHCASRCSRRSSRPPIRSSFWGRMGRASLLMGPFVWWPLLNEQRIKQERLWASVTETHCMGNRPVGGCNY